MYFVLEEVLKNRIHKRLFYNFAYFEFLSYIITALHVILRQCTVSPNEQQVARSGR